MSASTASVARRLVPGPRPHHPAWRDAGLVALLLGAVGIVYAAAAGAGPATTAAVLAVSTAGAMHARLAIGRWWTAGAVVGAAVMLLLAGAEPRLAGAVLITGLSAAELTARCTRRSAVLRAGGWTAIIAGAAGLSGLWTGTLPAGEALRESMAALGGALLGAPLMIAAGPLVEWLFGHTTRLTMGEWLSYDYPLLRQLTSAAPGTFQHSINVGVLADAAASAIAADALLARVGGLYHDVGKMRAPEYFIENQQGPNPHDDLDPEESAGILRAHVTDGVELVGARRMGEKIADFVREHHGTGTMPVLRQKAVQLGRPAASLDEIYRYPGPRPRSRETAIVMIADQVEATARSSPPADPEACEAIVRRTIERITDEGQLDDSGLRAGDLRLIRAAIARALSAMHHRRLTYPPSSAAPPPRRRLTLMPRMLARGRSGP